MIGVICRYNETAPECSRISTASLCSELPRIRRQLVAPLTNPHFSSLCGSASLYLRLHLIRRHAAF